MSLRRYVIFESINAVQSSITLKTSCIQDRGGLTLPVVAAKDMDIDLLALHFTSVKLLFVQGKMGCVF